VTTPRPDRRPASGAHRRAPSRSSEARRLLGPRLLVLALAGLALFGYPLLDQFRTPERLFGVPTLYLYLFGVWALFVGALAWLLESARPPRRGTRR